MRWRKALQSEQTRFFDPPHIPSRSARAQEMFGIRAAVEKAVATGHKTILISANFPPFYLPQHSGVRYVIYLRSAEAQAHWVKQRRPLTLQIRRRMDKMRKLGKNGHLFLAMSRFAAHGIAEEFHVPPSQVSVVPPPVDTELFLPAPSATVGEALRIGFVGDMEADGGDVLASLTRDTDLSRCYWSFLTDADLKQTERVAIQKPLEPESERYVAWLQELDLIVLPRRDSLFPLTALDAQACGVPVVVRNMGASNEVVEDGKSGFVLDTSDPADVKRAILTYLNMPQQLEEHGRRGRERVVRENSLAVHAARIAAAVAKVAS